MLTILVINAKGGSGKTTLTTNLASYFASSNARTAVMDYDPQGSSMQWLKIRPANAVKIHGASAAPPKGSATLHSVKAWVPMDTEVLVIDAPSGSKGLLLQELVRKANFIVIPVAPSPIDIHATAGFIKELYLYGGARTSNAKIAVVANRVRSSASPIYNALERFLHSLQLPFLTRIRDSDNYLHAVEKGLGVFEMDATSNAAEKQELIPILKWINHHSPNKYTAQLDDKILILAGTRSLEEFRRSSQNITSLSNTGQFKSTP